MTLIRLVIIIVIYVCHSIFVFINLYTALIGFWSLCIITLSPVEGTGYFYFYIIYIRILFIPDLNEITLRLYERQTTPGDIVVGNMVTLLCDIFSSLTARQ